jgi:hypothetical protein
MGNKKGIHLSNAREWTDQELQLLDSTLSNEEVAETLKRSVTSVELKRRRRRAAVRTPEKLVETTVEQDVEAKSNDYWKRQYDQLARKYGKLAEEHSVVDQLVADIKEVAPVSYDPAPRIIRDCALRLSKGKPQSAVLLLSDTHVGLEVRPTQTLGFGNYNFETFLARLKFLESAVLSILRDHTTTEVPELVIPILGDMLDGNLNHSAEAGQVNTLFSQFYGAGHAIAQFLRNVAAHVPKVRCYTVVGNHTRWGTQKKMPTTNRYSNLDSFLYAYLSALTENVKNIEWNLSTQPFSIFEIQGFRFHASHGDHLRGGDKALGIPNHSVGRQISTTTQLFNKHGIAAPHYYLTGHLHRGITLPHAAGEFIINGGFPGLDTYALMENFNPIDPIQRFFLVHPKYGRTAEYPISLKFAVPGDERPYVIPANFPIK